MTFNGFSEQDFDSLTVPGLEPRMEAIISRVRPKLEALGTSLSPYLSAICGEDMYPHVAKHARRKVNPPIDTWIAWAGSKRGYKALPHFEVGMFSTHLFVIFAVIYESPNKAVFADYVLKQTAKIKKAVPGEFYWSMDHMDPGGRLHSDTGAQDLKAMAEKLINVKKAEIMCGLRIDRDQPILRDGEQLTAKIEETFASLLPLYKASY
ncbi:YktB family protein [Fontibacillus sp. BL9]|uniref:YktB family protein n=1 Tax=Fontibacillus sp. BL9 TaxID=3389971 RepID=UPI0039787369